MRFAICDLRERPEFFGIVADRIWRAWWEPRGVARAALEERLRENLAGPGIPIAWVAHAGARFLGTASLIASDLEELPHLTPWVAAVWVEPDARGDGLGRALVAHAAEVSFTLGYDRVYLCALPSRQAFYTRQGWRALQHGIGARGVTLFARDKAVVHQRQ